MCGIIGGIVRDPASFKAGLREIYRNQAMRGRQGAGISVKSDGKLFRYRARTPEAVFRSQTFKRIKAGDYVLFHHRFPTSTPNKWFCNHPFANETRSRMMIHNGHISNYVMLANELLVQGHTFETMTDDNLITDSEVLVHLTENITEMDGIGPYLMNKAHGGFAIAMVGLDYDGILLFRSVNPIVIFTDEVNTYFASERPEGFEPVHEMRDGESILMQKRRSDAK